MPIPKVKLDKEARILSIKLSDKKSVDSRVQKNVVIDLDAEGNVVNIEIMNISLDEFAPVLQQKDLISDLLSVAPA